jgi:hypothetical protein
MCGPIIGPVLAFVIVFNVMQNFADETGPFSKETAIFWATGIFMGSVCLAIGWTLLKGRTTAAHADHHGRRRDDLRRPDAVAAGRDIRLHQADHHQRCCSR